MLKELDRVDEALQAAKHAALQATQSPEAHNAIGEIYQALGEFEPALAAYGRAAILLGPAQMDAIANRGALFMEFGRKEKRRYKRWRRRPGPSLTRRESDSSQRSVDRPDAGSTLIRGLLVASNPSRALAPSIFIKLDASALLKSARPKPVLVGFAFRIALSLP